MNRVDTTLGAVTAAAILIVGQFVALFTENPELTVADIKQATWIAIVGGGLLAFLKDFNAVSFRRAAAGVRGANGGANTFLAFIVLGSLVALGGCASRPSVDSLADVVAATAADIETAAQSTERLCANVVPSGPCASNALIDTELRDEIKGELQRALVYLNDANRALAADQAARADGLLNRATAVLTVVEAILRERE